MARGNKDRIIARMSSLPGMLDFQAFVKDLTSKKVRKRTKSVEIGNDDGFIMTNNKVG